MVMVKKNHANGSRTTHRTAGCYTQRRNGPVGIEDEVARHTIVAASKNRKEGIEEVQTTVPDPPLAGGVNVAAKISKQSLTCNADIVARGAIRRASAGKSVPIRRKPDLDPGGLNKEIGSGGTTPKDQKDLEKLERGQPS